MQVSNIVTLPTVAVMLEPALAIIDRALPGTAR